MLGDSEGGRLAVVSRFRSKSGSFGWRLPEIAEGSWPRESVSHQRAYRIFFGVWRPFRGGPFVAEKAEKA
jgi:hypothetical protein